MIASIIIFIIVYLLLATEKVEKSVAAVLGAVAVMLLNLISFEEAIAFIDFNVIFLLIGMMTCVAILAETGFFEWAAVGSAKIVKGNGFLILVAILALTMLFSALLDNVTTVVLLAPVTILLTQILELPTMPFLILVAMASNIGGTATLIGDPPNIIIGSDAQLSFMDFILNLSPIVLVIGSVFILTSIFFFRKHLRIPANIQLRVMDSLPSRAIRDWKKMYKALFIFALIFVGFFLHHTVHLEPGIIALGGMALMLLVCRSESESMLKIVEWDVILFFIGLFIVIGALEKNGAIDHLAAGMLKLCGSNIMLTSLVILCGSAIFSSVLDNIPFVIVMMPLIEKFIHQSGMTGLDPKPLYWALALGACLGGNGTIIGASANVVITKIGERNGYKITFVHFLKYGVFFMIQSVIIAGIYLIIRYF